MKCGMAALGQSAIGTIMCFLVAISCLLPIMWTCVRACSFADNCIPVLPALQAHAVLLSQDPEGVRVAPSGAGEDGESHHCETGGGAEVLSRCCEGHSHLTSPW